MLSLDLVAAISSVRFMLIQIRYANEHTCKQSSPGKDEKGCFHDRYQISPMTPAMTSNTRTAFGGRSSRQSKASPTSKSKSSLIFSAGTPPHYTASRISHPPYCLNLQNTPRRTLPA